MKSPLSFLTQPTPSPSKEGIRPARTRPSVPLLGGVRGGFARQLALLAIAATLTITARAAEEIEISKTYTPGSTPPIKINISGFTGEVNEVLNFDLYVMGFINVPADQAQFLIAGSNNGSVQGTVTDAVVKSVTTGAGSTSRSTGYLRLNKAYSGGLLRRQAHAFADDIVFTLTGTKGIAQTKIAFKVTAGGNGEIYVSDFDAHNAQAVTHDNAIVAAPAWVPGRLALYYTSYRLGSPNIFHHDLGSGSRTAFARYPGMSTSAAVSADGSRVAMILDKSGNPELWVCNADGSGLKQLTRTPEDESSPCWSPDGKWICYAGKQGGVRSLYKVSASGGAAQRISTRGVPNPSEPDWSPDGRWIVFTSQMSGFEICVVPAEGGSATLLVSGEDPSWAPNSRTVVFARRSGGTRRLSLLDVPTKQVKDAARISGSNSQPSWAK